MKEEIRKHLFELQDLKYREFHSKLMPTISEDVIIGIRTPVLRAYAKELIKCAKNDENVKTGLHNFMEDLPHKYYEENNLHGMLIEAIKDYELCIRELNKFIIYIDNWATCDLINPKVVKKYPKQFLEQIQLWLSSDKPYPIRYAIGMLMRYYLEDLFDETYLQWVKDKQCDEYYVNMMIAWYYATALAKQYESVLPYLENNVLETWVHNKIIQKAIESYRITPEQKDYLKTLRRKK